MNHQHQKWVTFSFLAVSVLLTYLLSVLLAQVAVSYDLEVRVNHLNGVLRALSIGSGAVLFLSLFFNKRANQFMNEVVIELFQVTWPTQKEAISSTGVVIVMVVISGFVLGLLDYIWTQLLRWVI